MKLLVDNGWVIPVDGRRPIIEQGAVAIDGTRIVAVGPRDEVVRGFAAERTLDATGKAVLPGFVNTHSHLMGAFNKAITEDPPALSGGLFKIAMPLQCKYIRPEEVYWPATMHALETLRTGTTTINEVWWFEREIAKAVRDVGLRAVIAENISEHDLTKLHPDYQERHYDLDEGRRAIETALAFIDEWHGGADGRITCRFGPFSADTCSEATLVRIRELAAARDLGFHVHLAQIPGEVEYMRKTYGKGSVQYLHGLGYLSPRFVGAHCVFMTPDEIDIMKDTGAHMSHTAYLVGKRGYFPPMPEIYERGVSVSIGADWLSNDMFKILRAAILLARHQAKSTAVIDAARILEMATMGGARALQLDREIGSLEVGKKADLFLLNLRLPWLNPIRPQNLVTNIVYNANGSDVTDVIVDGRPVVAGGGATMVDEDEVYRACQRTAESVWTRASALFDA